MTLLECYQANEGKALLVPGGGAGNEGQCAQWADTVLHDVYGQPYIYTPGAIDWYLNAEALGLTQHFDRVNDRTIRKGDFVIFGSGVGSVYGHIDLAAGDGSFSNYLGYDSNWGRVYNAQGHPILHTVNHNDSYNQYILGVLRPKGTPDMPSTIGDYEARIIIQRIYGYTNELDIEGAIPGLVGRESNEALRGAAASAPAAAYQKQIEEWKAAAGASNVKPYNGPPLFVKE